MSEHGKNMSGTGTGRTGGDRDRKSSYKDGNRVYEYILFRGGGGGGGGQELAPPNAPPKPPPSLLVCPPPLPADAAAAGLEGLIAPVCAHGCLLPDAHSNMLQSLRRAPDACQAMLYVWGCPFSQPPSITVLILMSDDARA